MMAVRMGGAMARPMVCEEDMMAVARARVAVENHSRVERMPEG